MSKQDSIIKYYKKQSVFYDFTRPLFLFGRAEIVDLIVHETSSGTLLEVGCGTGYLMEKLSQRTDLRLTGLDFSQEMLGKAKEKLSPKVELIYSEFFEFEPKVKYDYIVLSYVFTLDFQTIKKQVEKAKSLLEIGGKIFVVDFHKYSSKVYKKYMNWHGIEMGVELMRLLKSEFKVEQKVVKKAYGGVWEYFYYVGKYEKD